MGESVTRAESEASAPPALAARSGALVGRLPRTLSALTLALVSLGLLARSFAAIEPLSELPGFSQAVAHVDARLGPGQLVVVAPPEQAPALGLLPPSWAASDAVPIEAADARRHPELFVLAPVDAPVPPELRAARLVSAQRFDAVVVRHFRHRGSRRTELDLRRELDGVSVRLERPALACDTPLPEGGFACPGQPAWNRVGPARLLVEGRSWACVWAHPRSGRPLVIDLGERALAERIELEAALADGAVGAGGSPVKLRLEVDGLAARELVRTNAAGRVRLELPTVPGERRRVRLVVTAEDDARRHLGVSLRFTSGGEP